LTSIQGFAQAIVDGETGGDAVQSAADVIHREPRRLVRMVEGLLQVAKLSSGTERLAREDVQPARLIESAVAAMDVQAHDAGVRFEVADASALPTIRGDPDKLAQLILNLLDNAVKHSPRGAAVQIRGERADGTVIVRVRDAGSGLPEGAQVRLFQRFYRGDNAMRNGSGLGLALAQAIAEAHGGNVSAHTLEGCGAELAVPGKMSAAGLVAAKGVRLRERFVVPRDIAAAIRADPTAARAFRALPRQYVRIRIGFIDAARNRPAEFRKRLRYFITMTARGNAFGYVKEFAGRGRSVHGAGRN